MAQGEALTEPEAEKQGKLAGWCVEFACRSGQWGSCRAGAQVTGLVWAC